MKRLFLLTVATLAGILSAVGCMTETPISDETMLAPTTLQMTDTLAVSAPTTSLTGTWKVRQVNMNGQVYLGTISFLQSGKLLVGRADWANHPDGHLLGWVGNDRIAFGQGFTDTSKANLLGFYTASLANGGDSLVRGVTFSNGNDSGTFVAARVSDCPTLQLTPTPLPCQQIIDTLIVTDSVFCGLSQPDTSAAYPDTLTPLTGCWAVHQINAGGATYSGTLVLDVNGYTVSGHALWNNHLAGTLSGTVNVVALVSAISSPPTQRLQLVQSFTGDKAGLKGHYEGTLLANGALSGSTYATQDGVKNGDSATWTARRTSCPSAF